MPGGEVGPVAGVGRAGDDRGSGKASYQTLTIKPLAGNTVASAQREMMDRIDWLDPACVDRLPQASEAQNSEGMAQ